MGTHPRIFHWRTPRVWDADSVPVLADMFWVDAWPLHTDCAFGH